MKNLLSTLTAAAVIAGTFTMPATAYTTEKPAEYSHTIEDSVKNDKLYIRGYSVEDTKAFLWEDQIVFAEEVYGVDENGNIYIKEPNTEDESDDEEPEDEYLHDHEVEVYTIKDGEKKKINDYDSGYETGRSHWNKGLKPYTTYKFQLKISYLVGAHTYEDGTTKPVYKIHWSDPIKIRTCPKKTGFTFTKVARHTARLHWKAVKCEGYKLQQYNYKKKKWATIRTLPKSKTSAKLTGLKANTKYKFRVMPYGHVADKKYPRKFIIKNKGFIYSSALFAKPSKAVVLRTKK